jgi:hypothetical protein
MSSLKEYLDKSRKNFTSKVMLRLPESFEHEDMLLRIEPFLDEKDYLRIVRLINLYSNIANKHFSNPVEILDREKLKVYAERINLLLNQINVPFYRDIFQAKIEFFPEETPTDYPIRFPLHGLIFESDDISEALDLVGSILSTHMQLKDNGDNISRLFKIRIRSSTHYNVYYSEIYKAN